MLMLVVRGRFRPVAVLLEFAVEAVLAVLELLDWCLRVAATAAADGTEGVVAGGGNGGKFPPPPPPALLSPPSCDPSCCCPVLPPAAAAAAAAEASIKVIEVRLPPTTPPAVRGPCPAPVSIAVGPPFSSLPPMSRCCCSPPPAPSLLKDWLVFPLGLYNNVCAVPFRATCCEGGAAVGNFL